MYHKKLDRLIEDLTLIDKKLRFKPIKTITDAYTSTVFDGVLCADGTFTITLPPISKAYDSVNKLGFLLKVKNINTGTITITGYSSETIDGSASIDMSVEDEILRFQANSNEWKLI